MVNLLRNACEAMPAEGTVRIWTEGAPSEPDSVASFLRIHFLDDGSGIPPELGERVFDPFVTTKEEGTGFGLPLAVQALENLGGSITLAEPTSGEGAHFLIELPRHRDPDLPGPRKEEE